MLCLLSLPSARLSAFEASQVGAEVERLNFDALGLVRGHSLAVAAAPSLRAPLLHGLGDGAGLETRVLHLVQVIVVLLKSALPEDGVGGGEPKFVKRGFLLLGHVGEGRLLLKDVLPEGSGLKLDLAPLVLLRSRAERLLAHFESLVELQIWRDGLREGARLITSAGFFVGGAEPEVLLELLPEGLVAASRRHGALPCTPPRAVVVFVGCLVGEPHALGRVEVEGPLHGELARLRVLLAPSLRVSQERSHRRVRLG